MSDLPAGWEWTTIGEVANIQLGRQRSPKNHNGPHMHPYLRSANVTWGGIDLADVKEMNFEPNEAVTFELHAGDLLLNEASDSPNEVGKPAIWKGELDGCCFQNTLLRVRSDGPSSAYIYWYCRSAALAGDLGRAGRSVNIRHLGKQGLESFPLPLPPVAEQERIVAAIEEHLSRLDAAEMALGDSEQRLEQFDWRALHLVLEQDAEWPMVPMAEIAELSLGKMLDSKQQTGLHPTRYLRNINVRWGSFDVDDLATMDVDPSQFSRVSARSGDVVMCEGGEPGRCAVWRDDSPIAIQKALHRIRPSGRVLPEFLVMIFRQMARSGMLRRHFTGTTIKHLPKERLAAISLRLPPVHVQAEAIDHGQSLQSASVRLNRELTDAMRRSQSLCRSILVAAFAGQLVAQDSSDEPASVLLDRIRTERVAAIPSRRTRARRASL